MKVLDLSRILAGPWATMLLGDLGADVIKVEPPAGDATRSWGPPFIGETAVYYLTANRNKRSLVLDLAIEDDRRIARALAAEADVVVENFRGAGARRFGLAYEDLRAVNPECVYCSISGFGAGTRREAEPAYDLVVQAFGGIMGITGTADAPPVKVGVAVADLMAGLYASSAILAAVHERSRTGNGRHVEVTLLDTQVATLANQALNWLVAGYNPIRLGSDHPNVAPYGAFATSTGYIVIAVGSDRQFAGLAAVLGHADWAEDPRFATNAERMAHRAILRQEVELLLSERAAEDWLKEMQERGVPCAPVLDVAEVFADPEIRGRMVTELPESAFGPIPQVRSPLRIDGHALPNMAAPPALGEHTAEIVEHVKRHVLRDAPLANRGNR